MLATRGAVERAQQSVTSRLVCVLCLVLCAETSTRANETIQRLPAPPNAEAAVVRLPVVVPEGKSQVSRVGYESDNVGPILVQTPDEIDNTGKAVIINDNWEDGINERLPPAFHPPKSSRTPRVSQRQVLPPAFFPDERLALRQAIEGESEEVEGIPWPGDQSEVDDEVNVEAPTATVWAPWWADNVRATGMLGEGNQPVTLNQLMDMALVGSPIIQIAKLDSCIVQQAVPEQLGRFDWRNFVDAFWEDLDEATGNQLQAGAGVDRLIAEDFNYRVGMRKPNRIGGNIEFSQQTGLRDSNSIFFDPNDQGYSRFTFRYDQPLLRDGGQIVNMGRVYIAQFNAEATAQDAQSQIAELLLAVAREYWDVYQARSKLAIRDKNYREAVKVVEKVTEQAAIDAGPQLIAFAAARAAQRRGEVIDARTELQRQQNQLNAVVSVNNWEQPAELMPQDIPFNDHLPVDETAELQLALTSRAEVAAAMDRIQAATVAKQITTRQLLPRLAMFMELTASGIDGNFDVADAWTDQFDTGAPTYRLGLNFERPVGNNTAMARDRRASLELQRFTQDLERVTDLIKLEVKNAVTELKGSQSQLELYGNAATRAANEIQLIEKRRWLYPERKRVSSLYLRELLDAQDRLAESESRYVDAQVAYSFGILQLRRANGSLFDACTTAGSFVASGDLYTGNPTDGYTSFPQAVTETPIEATMGQTPSVGHAGIPSADAIYSIPGVDLPPTTPTYSELVPESTPTPIPTGPSAAVQSLNARPTGSMTEVMAEYFD